MAASKIIVLGASAGGIEATCRLLAGLPRGFPAPILIVQHIGRHESVLPSILDRCGPLVAKHPRHRELIQAGNIYVAPSNQHMVIRDGHIALHHGPRENRFRPAIDPLFRSAARAYRQRVIGILLSGELDDGVAGLFAIKARKGLAIVQDPNEATSPSMPREALEKVAVDHVLPVAEIGPMLTKLAPKKTSMRTTDRHQERARTAPPQPHLSRKIEVDGRPVPIVCPDCHGPLFELKNGKVIKFHCIVGHSYSPASLSDAHADALERALWIAIRTLKEKLTFQQKLMSKQANREERVLAQRMAEDAASIAHDIQLLEQVQAKI